MPNPFSMNGQDDQDLPPGMVGLPKWMLPKPASPASPASPAAVTAPAAAPVSHVVLHDGGDPASPPPTPAAPVARAEPVGQQQPDSMNAATPLLPGLRQIGNTNLNNRPPLRNPDGSVSTESSTSFGTNNGETLLPTVIGGKRLTSSEALASYAKTGKHMGIFDTPENADNYASGLEDVHEREIGGGNPTSTSAPAVSPAVAELTRLTQRSPASTANGNYDITKDQSRSGIEQIHNPFLRTLGRIGDTALSTLLPAAAVFTPGTQLHHQMNVNSARHGVEDEQGEQKSAEEAAAAPGLRAHTAAQTALETAQAEKATNPPPDPKDWEEVKSGPVVDPDHPESGPQVLYVNKNDPSKRMFVGQAAAKPTDAKETANVHVLPDGTVISVNHDSKTGKSTADVVYKGDPKVPTEVKQLEISGKPHQVLVNSQTGETIKDLGETGEKPPTVNINAENHQEVMKGKELLDKAETSYRAAAQGAKTLTDFVKSAQAGNKVTAQALPLEGALEITTTAGTKRINKTEVENYAGAGSLFDNIMGRLGKLKSGQPIPKDVQDDSVKLANILQSNAYQTYRDAHSSAVKRYGLKGEDPLPEPGGGQPKTGETKKFSNGKTGVWDGQGWVAQ